MMMMMRFNRFAGVSRFCYHDVRLRLRRWTYHEPARRGLAGRRCSSDRAHVMLCSTSALL